MLELLNDSSRVDAYETRAALFDWARGAALSRAPFISAERRAVLARAALEVCTDQKDAALRDAMSSSSGGRVAVGARALRRAAARALGVCHGLALRAIVANGGDGKAGGGDATKALRAIEELKAEEVKSKALSSKIEKHSAADVANSEDIDMVRPRPWGLSRPSPPRRDLSLAPPPALARSPACAPRLTRRRRGRDVGLLELQGRPGDGPRESGHVLQPEPHRPRRRPLAARGS